MDTTAEIARQAAQAADVLEKNPAAVSPEVPWLIRELRLRLLQAATENAALRVLRNHLLPEAWTIVEALRWTGDGYEWNPKHFDYRMEPLDALRRSIQVEESAYERLLECQKNIRDLLTSDGIEEYVKALIKAADAAGILERLRR